MDLACFHIPHFAAWALSQRLCDDHNVNAADAAIVACAHGRVLACTSGLRGAIQVGDPVDRARRMVPQAQFLLRDPAVEKALWDHVLFRLYDLTPQVQPIPDPLSTGLRSGRPGPRMRSGSLHKSPAHTTDRSGLWDNGAWALLQGPDHSRLPALATELGASVGVSSARSWAMLAAAYADAGAVTQVPAHMVTAFLRQAPIGLLATLRFDPDLIERLGLFGMRAVHHAIHLTRRQLQAQFGHDGVRLFELLHPVNTEPPVAHFDPCVIDTVHDFDWPVFEPGEIQPVLHHLLAQLVTRLDGRSVRHIEILLRGRSPHPRRASRILKEPAARFDVLRNVTDTLLHMALTGANAPGKQVPVGRSVQRLRLTCSGLTEVPGQQAQLFAQRTDLLPALVRSMESRFPGKLTRPVRAHADPFFPEEEYRFEPLAK